MIALVSVLFIGVNIYRIVSIESTTGFNTPIISSYLWTKVKSSPLDSLIYVDYLDDSQILCILEDINSIEYITRVYYYDGWIREFFSSSDFEFKITDGYLIYPSNNLDIQIYENYLTVIIDSFAFDIVIPGDWRFAYE